MMGYERGAPLKHEPDRIDVAQASRDAGFV
jgi:hypothetical protein